MRVNGIDVKKYGAKQLTVEIQPPEVAINYEWMQGALQPAEFETTVAMGRLKLCVYFKGRNRERIFREMSGFMANFMSSCDLELDGYKGKYKGFLKADDFEKTISKKRHKINLEFDGYFYDTEMEAVFDGCTSGIVFMEGSRKTPCIIEVYAKKTLENYAISGFGEDVITLLKLEAGKTAVIDGVKGLVTISEKNAFGNVDLWEFPNIKPGKSELTFSNVNAKVTVKYCPMWI